MSSTHRAYLAVFVFLHLILFYSSEALHQQRDFMKMTETHTTRTLHITLRIELVST